MRSVVSKANQMEKPPLDGQVIQPIPTEAGRAAAIIAGHDDIMALGTERAMAFHAFVQEVLATTVEAEIKRVQRERDIAVAEREVAREARYAADDKIERLRALLNDKQYVQMKADYNRGHRSWANMINERERDARVALNQQTEPIHPATGAERRGTSRNVGRE